MAFVVRVNASPSNASDTFNTQPLQVAIFNDVGSIVYISESIDVETTSQVVWLNDQTVVIGEDASDRGSYTTLRRIQFPLELQNGEAERVKFRLLVTSDYRLPDLISPHRTYGIDTQSQIPLNLYTLTPAPLFRDPLSADYEAEFAWHDDHALIVRVSPRDDDQPSITYRVLLP